MVPGNSVYKERRVVKGKTEYRLWDPFRSKLAAAIINGLAEFPFDVGTRVLYLGVSTGTTASHISDIVGQSGVVFGVEHASRVAREFMDRVATHRKNVIPIIQDAKRPREYFGMSGKADVIYADIAQPDQTEIVLENCRVHLKKDGWLLFVAKPRSIDATASPSQIIKRQVGMLEGSLEVVQVLNLHPYDKDHAIVLARASGQVCAASASSSSAQTAESNGSPGKSPPRT